LAVDVVDDEVACMCMGWGITQLFNTNILSFHGSPTLMDGRYFSTPMAFIIRLPIIIILRGIIKFS